MAFATKPVRYWNQTDVQNWLRAGFSAEFAPMGWTQKLSHDYTTLFRACDFDGGSVIAMQNFVREDWLAMAEELSDQQRKECHSKVTLGDRMRLMADVQARVASQASDQGAASGEWQNSGGNAREMREEVTWMNLATGRSRTTTPCDMVKKALE